MGGGLKLLLKHSDLLAAVAVVVVVVMMIVPLPAPLLDLLITVNIAGALDDPGHDDVRAARRSTSRRSRRCCS